MKNINGIEKVRRARARLMLSQPFYGAASLNLKLVEDHKCKTAYTDGKVMGFNPDYINALDIREVEFIVAHEVLHCIMLHPTRQGKRDHVTYNMAGDYVINLLLTNAGLKMPANGLIDSKYKGLSSEQVYDIIQVSQSQKQPGGAPDNSQDEQDEQDSQGGQNDQDNQRGSNGNETNPGENDDQDDGGNTGNDNGNDGNPGNSGDTDDQVSNDQDDDQNISSSNSGDGDGDGDQDQSWNIGETRPGSVITPADKEQLENDWKINAVRALNQARAAGKVPAGMERLIEEIVVKKRDIETVLRDFVQKIMGSGDYTWRHLNRRYLAHNIYLPGMRDDQIPDLVMVLDTSGSIDQDQVNYFAAKINSVLSEYKTKIHVIYCDTEAHYSGEYGPEDQPVSLKPIGYGETDFRPPFKMVDDMGIEPAALIYMTDLECYDYPVEPHYPVLWALWNKYGKYTAPWGETVDITPE